MGTRSSYTRQFKKDAVTLVTEHQYSCDEVARRLGVDRSTIYRWVNQYEEGGEGGLGRKQTTQDEFKELEKENQRLKMENEILKKAAAYFAKELK